MASLKIPRLFFNILPMFNVSQVLVLASRHAFFARIAYARTVCAQVYWISQNSSYCANVHNVFPFECICAFDSNQQKRTYIDSVGIRARHTIQCAATAHYNHTHPHPQILVEFNKRIYKIAAEWKARPSQTFAVQIQPFTANRTCALSIMMADGR